MVTLALLSRNQDSIGKKRQKKAVAESAGGPPTSIVPSSIVIEPLICSWAQAEKRVPHAIWCQNVQVGFEARITLVDRPQFDQICTIRDISRMMAYVGGFLTTLSKVL